MISSILVCLRDRSKLAPISGETLALAVELASRPGLTIDPVVSVIYKGLIGKDFDYPIPDIRLPQSNRKLLLDVGCNWGRWSIAAARRG